MLRYEKGALEGVSVYIHELVLVSEIQNDSHLRRRRVHLYPSVQAHTPIRIATTLTKRPRLADCFSIDLIEEQVWSEYRTLQINDIPCSGNLGLRIFSLTNPSNVNPQTESKAVEWPVKIQYNDRSRDLSHHVGIFILRRVLVVAHLLAASRLGVHFWLTFFISFFYFSVLTRPPYPIYSHSNEY